MEKTESENLKEPQENNHENSKEPDSNLNQPQNQTEEPFQNLGKPSEKQNKKLSTFVSEALRKPRHGIYQQLLAQLLISANNAIEPWKKIQKICDAAYLTKTHEAEEPDKKEAKSKIDFNLVDNIATINTSFIQTIVRRDSCIRVAWNFLDTKENWKRYIEPWQHVNLNFIVLRTSYAHEHTTYDFSWKATNKPLNEREQDEYNLEKEMLEQIRDLPLEEKFFVVTSALSENSFQALKGEFYVYALKILLPIQAIISEEIDPLIWKELLSLMQRQKGEKEASEGMPELPL